MICSFDRYLSAYRCHAQTYVNKAGKKSLLLWNIPSNKRTLAKIGSNKRESKAGKEDEKGQVWMFL